MSTRDHSKSLRRQRILEAANQILVASGYDGLTTRGLAEAADVTVPTIYNLIGSKDEVLKTLIMAHTERILQHWHLPDDHLGLDAVDAWLDTCQSFLAADKAAVRALHLASDRVAGLYTAPEGGQAHNATSPALSLATSLCQRLQDGGQLHGHLPAESLGEQMFTAFRDPLRDWALDLISFEEFMRRFSRGVYMTLCCDATETARRRLIDKLKALELGAVHKQHQVA